MNVELIPAFFWYCPECDSENFERAIAFECSEEDKVELFEAMDVLEHMDTSDLLRAPEVVKCKSCNKEFNTMDYNDF